MSKTPKQAVVESFPLAYSVKYGEGRTWCVYSEPAKVVPRGAISTALVLGIGSSAGEAWRMAAQQVGA